MAPWIIIAAIGIAIAIVIAVGIERRSRRERQLEERRVEAGEHREKAEVRTLRANVREEAARDELDRGAGSAPQRTHTRAGPTRSTRTSSPDPAGGHTPVAGSVGEP